MNVEAEVFERRSRANGLILTAILVVPEKEFLKHLEVLALLRRMLVYIAGILHKSLTTSLNSAVNLNLPKNRVKLEIIKLDNRGLANVLVSLGFLAVALVHLFKQLWLIVNGSLTQLGWELDV